MEHYDELGVDPSASTAEIRSSYLALARRYHPDRLMDAAPAERDDAAARMARINAAWAVLSDQQLRARYDAALVGGAPTTRIRDPGRTWVPFDDTDEVDPRLADDTPTGAPTIHRTLTFLPAALAVSALLALILGFVVGLAPLLVIGLALGAGSGLSFLLIPLVALAASSRADRDH